MARQRDLVNPFSVPAVTDIVDELIGGALWQAGSALSIRIWRGFGNGTRCVEATGNLYPRLTIDFESPTQAQRLERAERLVRTMAEELDAAKTNSTAENAALKGIIGALARQAILSQTASEQWVRARGIQWRQSCCARFFCGSVKWAFDLGIVEGLHVALGSRRLPV